MIKLTKTTTRREFRNAPRSLRVLYEFLVRQYRERGNPVHPPPLEAIAERLGYGRHTVQTGLQRLHNAGLINKTLQPSRQALKIQLVDTELLASYLGALS